MNDEDELFTIGQLSRSTGLSTRTIRFWSDSGLLPPTARSYGGYRLYDAAAVGRLELVRTLRELGMDLDTVAKVLAEQVTVTDVARTHVTALDAEIRTLRVRRAVLRAVVRRGGTTEEMKLMHELARLSAGERQRILDEFVERAFDGTDPAAPGAGLADSMRQLPAELPDDPTDEQVNAWVELAELVRDEDFQRRVREMAVAGSEQAGQQSPDFGITPELVVEHAGAALAAGVAPDAPEAAAYLDRIAPKLPAAERAGVADQLATFTDRRVERYWHLLGVLNGWPPRPAGPAVPAFEWVIAALRASH
ncbi:MerR family transcriptional regulator [Crossiella sp. SN42]|uniref:helix-turn-helix domain-containing protein n=1 Tax=Crossiella sp. SN42 TaxID=2944808 RepID=UPI00207D45C3|nr:MerR family transcriptional regulator [Crossiella sp. SN42]MCO1580435.1 MerR family transcriptional regulator [Crossiella sp. SN42]